VKPDGHALIIGAANLDIKGRPASAVTQGTSTPGIISASHGGVARNIAENLARLEVDTVLLTSVGDDDSGERILGHAAALGIDISEALSVNDQRSGAYMALVNEHGALDFAIDDMSVLAALTPDYFTFRRSLFEDARLVVMDANLSPAAMSAVVRLCAQAKVPLCADPTSILLAPRLIPYLSSLHLIVPNHYEAEALLNTTIQLSDREAAQAAAANMVAQGLQMAVITLGEFGVVYANAETAGHIPAVPGQIVDPTGAGDAMTAAIIFGILEGIPLDECVQLGVNAATLTMRSRDTVRPDLSIDLLYDALVS